MAQIPGGLIVGGAGEAMVSAMKQGARFGALAGFVGGAVAVLASYKNEGWYATGGVWETWITSDAPDTVPPSGHTLTFVQHLRRAA